MDRGAVGGVTRVGHNLATNYQVSTQPIHVHFIKNRCLISLSFDIYPDNYIVFFIQYKIQRILLIDFPKYSKRKIIPKL